MYMSKLKKKRIVVYTAIFDFIDYLKEPDYLPDDCKFVCFTNMPLQSENYEIRRVYEDTTGNPNLNAKIYKILPHRYFEDYEYSVWIDGTMFLTSNIHKVVSKYLSSSDMAFFSHPWRNCIYDEAIECILKGRGNVNHIEKQIEIYKCEGYPKNNGLISAGIILRRNSETVKSINEQWWKEIIKHSSRDQISFNYIAYKNNFEYSLIDGDIYCNPYFGYIPHLFQIKKHRSDYLQIRKKNKELSEKVYRFGVSPEYKLYKLRKYMEKIFFKYF